MPDSLLETLDTHFVRSNREETGKDGHSRVMTTGAADTHAVTM